VPAFDFAKLQVEFAGGALGSADFYCGLHYPFRGQELEAVARDGGLWLGRGHDGKAELRVYDRAGDRVEDVPSTGRSAELAHWRDVCRHSDRADAQRWFGLGCETLAVLLAFREAWQTGHTVDVHPL
jgi:hypothetical protein